MDFLNRAHFKIFLDLREDLDQENKDKKEYLSILFLASGNNELYNKVLPYLGPNHFRYNEMLKEQTFSNEEQILAQLCVYMFNQAAAFELCLLEKLSRNNFKLALNAIKFRYEKLDFYYPEEETFSILKSD